MPEPLPLFDPPAHLRSLRGSTLSGNALGGSPPHRPRSGSGFGRRLLRFGGSLVVSLLLGAGGGSPAAAQLVSQSELGPDDRNPDYPLTLEHLSMDLRWMGVPPRELRWSPDGAWLYFRWREDPEPDQEPSTDPWYAVDREGTEVRRPGEEEVRRIPTRIQWSGDGRRGAWEREGTVFLWDAEGGTRAVYSADDDVAGLTLSRDGRLLTFATRRDRGEIWRLDLESGVLREVARVVTGEREDTTDADRWLAEQQVELIETLGERRRSREAADSVRSARSPTRVQEIPVVEGREVRNLALSPDGTWITFLEVTEPTDRRETHFMDFVTESGHATPRDARPKVGSPRPSYRTGIVRVDPSLPTDSVEVTWVDDGLEEDDDRGTIVHGPWFSPVSGGPAVVQVDTDDYKERWVAFLDLESGETTPVHHLSVETWLAGPLTVGRMTPGYLEWLPDGSAFGFGSHRSGWEHLWLAEVEDAPGGERTARVRELTSGAWEVRDVELARDGASWYLTTSREHPGEEHLYRLPVRGGEATRITRGEGIHGAVVSPGGDRVADRFETSRLLPDLYLQDAEPGDEPVRITRSGTDEFFRIELLDSEIVTFEDPEGEPTWAEIWERPDEFHGATVVYAHGCGECAQAVTKGWRRVGAKLYAKFLAQRGYLSANLDYRGSSGYGHDNRTYAYRQMGVRDIDSGLPLLDLLVEEHGADPERIGVYGGSYGGFFSLMALFRHPDRYAAGVALYPVTDWAHYNHSYTARILNGAPVDDPEAYRVSSPIYYVDGYRGGLQIQHGLVDGNVQIQDVFRLTQVLLEKDRDFDLVVYPLEDHGWDEEESRRDSYRRMTRWFERHLLGRDPIGEETFGENR